MRSAAVLALLAFTIVASGESQAAGSLLRITCDGADVGAEVTVNGVFKGECPLDIQVNAGTIRLRLLKKVDALRERVFEQEFRMGDGVVKKVEAALSAPQLNAEGLKREREREAARQAAAAEERRLDQEVLEQQQKAAEAGDTDAMLALADRHAGGKGVPGSDEQANAWYRKAAAAGNEAAAFKLSPLYKTGAKEDVAAVARMLTLPADNERTVNIEGHENVQAFVASDAFFQGAAGGQKISYTYIMSLAPTMRMSVAMTCQRNGNLFATTHKTQLNDASTTTEGSTLLGSLIWLNANASHGFLRSTRAEITRLEKVQGQPFPLAAGKRFGVTYTQTSSGTYSGTASSKVTCALTDVKVKSVGQFQIPENAQQVICLTEGATMQPISRWYLHEGSGCLVNTGKP